MREGSYHTIVLGILKANPRKHYSAEQLAHEVGADPKKASMNSVCMEIMRKHSPHVHREKLNKPEQVRRFYYWFDDTRVNDIYQGTMEDEAPSTPSLYELLCGITIPADKAHQVLNELSAVLEPRA